MGSHSFGARSCSIDISVPPVYVRLPKPNSSRTLPKATGTENYSSLTLYSQPSETVQDLKLAVSEWIGGYWLGPYSLRLPGQPAEALSQSKDGVDIHAGEKLSEWLEIGDVFAHVAEEGDRSLEVVKGEWLFYYFDARLKPSRALH